MLAQSLTGSLVIAPLGLPAIAAVTGLSFWELLAIIVAHTAWRVVSRALLLERIRGSAAAFHVMVLGNAIVGSGVMVALVIAAGDPMSVLWVAPVMYATMNGGLREFAPSIALHIVHVGTALSSIPIFLAMGAPVGASIGGPLVGAAFCLFGYHYLADVTSAMRAQRRAQEEEIDAARARIAELERKRLMRDLHDTVGSALGVTALYAQLLEEHAEDPEVLRDTARALRETAQGGLGDLRGGLEALDPATSDVAELAASLEWLGARACAAAGGSISVHCRRGGETPLAGPVRVAMVRIFQESVANALRHGGAAHVAVTIDAGPRELVMRIEDDGRGFDDAAVHPRGRGVRGIRERCEELGGEARIESAPGQGATVSVALPLSVLLVAGSPENASDGGSGTQRGAAQRPSGARVIR